MIPMTNWIRAPRWLALRLVAALVLAAAVASFAQSYRGLYLWAVHHGLSGFWSGAWPLQVDTFIVVGEIALFVALVDNWDRRRRAVAWTVTLVGLAVSVAGNIGHAPTKDLATRVTFAVPPLSAAAALFVGLVILKAVMVRMATPEPVATVVPEMPLPKPQEWPRPVAKRPAKRSNGGQRDAAIAALVAEPNMTAEDLETRFGGTGRTARRWRASAKEMATSNGHH